MSISKCDNPTCPIKEQCYRFRKPDHPYRQPYTSFKFDFELHECEYFIPYSPTPKTSALKTQLGNNIN